eukprot:Pgem_evm1s17208
MLGENSESAVAETNNNDNTNNNILNVEHNEEIDFEAMLREYEEKVQLFSGKPRQEWSEDEKQLFCKRLRLEFCRRKDDK